jgi:type I restriction enzyme S subunit
MVRESSRVTPLDEFVSRNEPICYGILKPGSHVTNGIPVVKVKNIVNGQIDEEGILLTSPEIHRQYKRSALKTGDLLLTIRGTTGRVAFVPPSLDGANITQDTARIRVTSEDSPIYLYYALQSSAVQRQIKLNTIGQAVKGINIAEVKKLQILHPSKEQQVRIGQILSTWDKAIETTDKLIKNSKAQKKALMLQLLTGKWRLPGFKKPWRTK